MPNKILRSVTLLGNNNATSADFDELLARNTTSVMGKTGELLGFNATRWYFVTLLANGELLALYKDKLLARNATR